MNERVRRAKILATLGPATSSEDGLRHLIAAGANALRVNFSYGNRRENARLVQMAHAVSREVGCPVAVVQDLQGPKVRLSPWDGEPIALTEGAQVVFSITAQPALEGERCILPIDAPALVQAASEGRLLLLGDGDVELRVTGVGREEVVAEVISGGEARPNQGIVLPGVSLGIDSPTGKDIEDLAAGIEASVDYVALSFVENGDDVKRLKAWIRRAGADIPVIAKIEREEAIVNLDSILSAADGVMVARGDLALEIGPEKVPLVQKDVVRRANAAGVLVITATQMLESMIHNRRPSRAEASDIANAVLDGTDVVMLSAETAIGRYPAEAVQMMSRIAAEAESMAPLPVQHEQPPAKGRKHAQALSSAASRLARDVNAAALVVFTRSGYSARLLSKERPPVPIYAFTPSETTLRRLALWWGVDPIPVDSLPALDEMIALADRRLTASGALQPGQIVVVAHWGSLDDRWWGNMVQVHRLRGG
jgi:pyruvate kinase